MKNARGNKDGIHFETLAIHAGAAPDPETGACGTPIHQAAAFKFRSTTHAANAFSLKEKAFIYSRLTNPTVEALEEKMAALEGGVGATCTPSGLAANLLVFSAIMETGADFVSSCKIYGGSVGQFRDTFSRAFGWTCHFVDPTDPANFERAITDKTRALFAESISNPEGVVSDLEALSKIAEKHNIPLIIDNTVATPYLCRPFEYGASVVVHSTTKYLSGHGNAMGGVVIDGGTFNWKKNADKYPALGKEVASYNNIIFADSFEESPLAVHNHAVGLRDLGLNQQPMNAYLTMLGIQTLPLRMEKHCRNAIEIAEYLKKHPAVSWVNFTGLSGNPSHALAQKYMKNGWASSLFSFGLKAGYAAAVQVVENVKLFTHLANLGDTRSLIIHPASTTHAQLSEEQKIKAGAFPDAIRISVGLENAADLIADLDQALAQTKAKAA